jgi:hypothetical protein
VVLVLVMTMGGTAQADPLAGVLTQHNDNQRTGANLAETELNTGNVPSLKRIFRLDVDGQIVAQPLYAAGVFVRGVSRNVLYVATEANHLYAFDADNFQRLADRVLDGPPYRIADAEDQDVNPGGAGGLATPFLGITSTPVIDPVAQTLFLLSKTDEQSGNDPRTAHQALFHLHALALDTLEDKENSPLDIDAEVGVHDVKRRPAGSFVPYVQNNRPGLLLDHGVLYLAFAALPFDFDHYHGFVFAYIYGPGGFTRVGGPTRTTTSAPVYGAGVWQAGYGLVADPDGNVYFQTGNLKTTTSSEVPDLGNAIVKLRSRDLVLLDKFISPLSAYLNAEDLDLGSAGPLLLPKIGGFRLLGGGKQGIITLHELDNLSQPLQMLRGTFNQYHQLPVLRTSDPIRARFHYPHIHSTPVYWEYSVSPLDLDDGFGLGGITSRPRTVGHVYVWGERDILRAFSYSRATGFSLLPLASSHVTGTRCPFTDPKNDPNGDKECLRAVNDVTSGGHDPDVGSTARNATGDVSTQGPDGMPGGMLSLSAHGSDPSTGIVWAATNTSGDSENQFVPGILRAFQAVPVTGGRVDNNGGAPDSGLKQLWTNAGMDAYFLAKFTPPTVFSGKVYLPANTIPNVAECATAEQPCVPPNHTGVPGANAWTADASDIHGHVFVYGLSCLPTQIQLSNGVCEFKADIVTILGATLFIPPLDVIPKTGAQLSVEATSNNPAALLFLTVRGCPTVQDAPMTRNGSNYDFFSTVGRADCAFSISSLGAMAMVRSSLGGTASKRIDVRR